MYLDKELKEYVDSKLTTLQSFGVKPHSTISLIVILYSIPDTFDEVIFDLFWGYPSTGVDYLDASVLLYSGYKFIELLDWSHLQCQSSPGALRHSGDKMDANKRLGHHTINVKLKSISPQVDKLFFTLSAWNSPNISKYKNPSLRFFDAKCPNQQLCDDKMDHAAYSQAIIMCSLCKVSGSWQVFRVKSLSAGNAKNYAPLQASIAKLINAGKS